jgi:hypothetical protein
MTSRCFNGINLFAFTTLPWIRLVSRIYSEYPPAWGQERKNLFFKRFTLACGGLGSGEAALSDVILCFYQNLPLFLGVPEARTPPSANDKKSRT